MNIGDGIKKLRKEKGISQIELSKLTGLSQTALSLIEKGQNSPTSITVDKIAKALSVDEDLIYLYSLSNFSRVATHREVVYLIKILVDKL